MKVTHSETAKFIAEESVELAKLAERFDMKTLIIIFNMAELEARNELNAKSTQNGFA